MRKRFCRESHYADGELVSEEKLCQFLRERILDREIRPSRYTREQSQSSDGSTARRTLGLASIDQYVNALVDLWRFQKDVGANPYRSPRGQMVSALLHDRKREEIRRRRQLNLNRSAGILLDGNSTDKIADFVRFCWAGWQRTESQNRKPQAQESYLRTAVDFLLGHFMLLRGETRRNLELADMFAIELPDEGRTRCWPMIVLSDNGKATQSDRIRYMGVMRHKDPLLCTMGQVGFYLFYRWQILKEPPPGFRNRQCWYNCHLLKGREATRPLTYETQLQWVNEVFDSIGLESGNKTQLWRGQRALQAEIENVPEAQVRRDGQWNQEELSERYRSHLPRQFLRSMAGFQPGGLGSFYLERAEVAPPEPLTRAIWPWVDDWLAWFESEESALPSLEPASEQEGAIDRRDIAAQAFLRLLSQLRTVILQDSVVLREEFPNHVMWSDPVFRRPEYAAFAAQVTQSLPSRRSTPTAATAPSPMPQQLQIQETVILIREELEALRREIARLGQLLDAGRQERSNAAREQLAALQRHVATLQQLNDGVLGREPSSSSSATALTTIHQPDRPSPSAARQPLPPGSAPTAASPSFAAGCLQPLPTGTETQQPNGTTHSPGSVLAPAPNTGPRYTMSRSVQTVPDLWKEWTQGVDGNPSIQELESRHGASWRTDQKEKMFYHRRRKIVEEIERRHIQEGISYDAAVDQLEHLRTEKKLSLHKLSEALRLGHL